jgi:hypothetical protein
MEYLTYIAVFAAIIIVFIILYKIFRFVISLLLIGVFLILAYFTNPNDEQHREAVKEKATKVQMILKNKKIVRENYYIFSITKVYHKDEHRVIGAGAFTKVFIFAKP